MKQRNFFSILIPGFFKTPIIGIICLSFTFTCFHPIQIGIFFQRQFLGFYGLQKKDLNYQSGKLVYFEGGTGPTMILAHGFIAEAGNWYTVVSKLKKNFHLVILDFPGHGESDPQGDELLPEVLLDGLLVLIDEKSKKEKIILVGNSMGGWVSLMAALQRPGKISTLILENSAGLSTNLPEKLLLPKDVHSAKLLYDMLLAKDAPTAPDFLYKDLIYHLNQKRYVYLFKSLKDKYFLDGKLKSLDMPVFLIWGDADQLFPAEYALRLQAEIPHSVLFHEKFSGHAMHFMQPDIFISHVLSALKK